MITLSLDPDIEELTIGLDRLSRQVRTAIKRAVRKLILWLRRQMLRQASQVSGVAQKEIIRHRRIYLDIKGMEGTVWLGTSPLPLHLAGRVSWNPSSIGATVAGRQYAGAFYRNVHGGGPKVWIRSSRNLREGHPTYHGKRRHRSFSHAVSHDRFPVEILGTEMNELEDEIARRLERRAHTRFRELLEQELNYVLNHERAG
ncbi:MAG: hypothetical protein BECKG1743D_GA0114223_102032 [Candidatus Kentron sp. G]|nr:MAG: hypothetical protein BECKG1743F_GA0114225_101603 [Candidatus Kentron sp. G]VFM98100.1 MAG: hypothetical protein BECKG1743E_GA0114224_101692 [Candidatus Kentron sp. G]VFN00523.1 MAG: hypothetical protein BECKG1743D_GA0114223_102032 [Candidatus Kentron sp. G]